MFNFVGFLFSRLKQIKTRFFILTNNIPENFSKILITANKTSQKCRSSANKTLNINTTWLYKL